MTANIDILGDHICLDTQPLRVAKDPNSRNGHVDRDTHSTLAVTGSAQTDPANPDVDKISICRQLDLSDPSLSMAAEILDDLEKVRVANENRLRQLTREGVDKDGGERGFGLPADHPDVKQLAALVEDLQKAEHKAELNLKRMMRKHPLGSWVKNAHGIGEKQAARLLAAIGDPYWNDTHNRPCTVSELWAYCGYHVLPVGHTVADIQDQPAGGIQAGSSLDHLTLDAHGGPVGVAASRIRGVRSNWSSTAKMRAYLIAKSIVKAGGPYRAVYDTGRAKYAEAAHKAPCRRCGPAGRPAMPGSLLSKGHQYARALRLVAKEVLKDLWCEAKRLHEKAGSERTIIKEEGK